MRIHWNHSPTWWTENPITQIYIKITSCFSVMIFLVARYPAFCSSATSILKISLWTPSLLQMQSGWPSRSPLIQPAPVRMNLWYGMALGNWWGADIPRYIWLIIINFISLDKYIYIILIMKSECLWAYTGIYLLADRLITDIQVSDCYEIDNIMTSNGPE